MSVIGALLPLFSGIWTEYGDRIQSECKKIQTWETPNRENFYAVFVFYFQMRIRFMVSHHLCIYFQQTKTDFV